MMRLTPRDIFKPEEAVSIEGHALQADKSGYFTPTAQKGAAEGTHLHLTKWPRQLLGQSGHLTGLGRKEGGSAVTSLPAQTVWLCEAFSDLELGVPPPAQCPSAAGRGVATQSPADRESPPGRCACRPRALRAAAAHSAVRRQVCSVRFPHTHSLKHAK